MTQRIHRALEAHTAESETWRAQMEPLTVRLTLRTPLSVTRAEDIALDGLLADCLLKRLLGDDFWRLPGPRENPVFVRLPLAMQGPEARRAWRWRSGFWPDIARDYQDAWWWWAASTARLEDVAAHSTDTWNKRFDTRPQDSDHIDFGGRAEKVVIEQGRFKAYHQPLPVVTCRAISWSCVGHADTIRDLLNDVPFIGKKAAIGYGEVSRVSVEPAAADESLLRADGALARPVPLAALDQMDGGYELAARSGRAYIAYRAPQWLPYNQAVCAVADVAEVEP